ncbi:bifunctional [glutamine synthetase] adenylyltransferase/[glutamine synthetase]-adenylyl-L-tyrosine phosphorylase [Gryllotalpicola ginsengisoli]|uniref:bifunctional [glutamine synthetase] adenylyltransferase/[glutamine synthetase]-adenylyl-L-tyrosine phosphorylase n=1 Tax=Gryllotalpicola ginsengisoli TaxID=444608 RepID=UPI0003B6BE7A|nr:bifunctional [glutamine synthetase] adenylyltransferase/[glutamine synthetase]-adenylyl-L-tyrosine phosphorylase [Gryllotalpicola ginsengisoli]
MRVEQPLSLTALARAGFTDLDAVRGRLAEFEAACGLAAPDALALFRAAADPDAAIERALGLLRRDPDRFGRAFADAAVARRLVRVIGASQGLADFLQRRPGEVDALRHPISAPFDAAFARTDLLEAVGADPADDAPVAALVEEEGWAALRVRYRRRLLQLADYDLGQEDPVAGLDAVAACLADLAGAVLEASLAVARATARGTGPGRFAEQRVADTRLAILGMGKAGARELNYVSDVDVIFVCEGDVDVATRLAVLTMRGADAPAVEPGLWQVDANLRPEGKDGALVRTLASHLAYYERWAQTWEFQALLKARPLAGDAELGARYVSALAPQVWSSSQRDGFVESVQRMRERVLDHIAPADVDYELKLGPGGLRDIEFTVQLLQLVHGYTDERVRQRATLDALAALVAGGYVGREPGARLDRDYRTLRLMEHRLQLERLSRTHLMPRDERRQRVLARATGLAVGAAALVAEWQGIKRTVRGLHEQLFYRPLLSAVAALSPADRLTGERALSPQQAQARLAAIGFRDPRGALAHLAALTEGVSRAATIQRTLLPVLLQWLSEGADPDYGLLTFRRLSEDLGSSHWFLRMLRDSSGAAQRLSRLISGSRFVGELLGALPEAVAWLDSDEDLRPRPRRVLEEERDAVLARHETADAVAQALRSARRREVLRLAFAGILGVITIDELARGLTDIVDVLLEGVLAALRRERRGSEPHGFRFAVIAMGRYGGRELGFGSDADVMYVYRSADGAGGPEALRLAAEISRLTADPRLPLDLDAGLRPEGRNGPLARSLEAYAAYYARWSLTWEAQALLRARGAAGDRHLIADFEALADRTRYPETFGPAELREVRRIKARVESERLPQGADPARHLKLGRGSLSDVEWYVQLLQLQHAARIPALRTTSTLEALAAEVEAGLVPEDDAQRLRAAWLFASRARSAMTLWTARTSDVLPSDRTALDGVARLMEYPPRSAARLEEDYLAVTRRARAVFERGFYGDGSA